MCWCSSNNSNTIYEKSINIIFGNNKRLLCSLLPIINSNSNICKVNNLPYVIYKFPIHIIKLLDDSILAVFNDGFMYTKPSMDSNLWQGPIKNSMPKGNIPLRMVTLSTDLLTILGVGYDNILYVKRPKTPTNSANLAMDLTGTWTQVPNNSSIIYVLFDNKTNFLISIDINGKLLTKTTLDITSINRELITLLDRPVLRLYFDLNGYMLAIDNKFDLYQFTNLDWKTSPLQTQRGANPHKLHDILYDNDGKLYGIIFNTDEFKLQIMKQKAVFYLSDFYSLTINNSSLENSSESTDVNSSIDIDSSSINTIQPNFLLSNTDILKCKIGSLYDFIAVNKYTTDNDNDNDINFAYQKQVMETEKELRQFCINRGSNTQNINYDNYELLGNVENNNGKIVKLKSIIANLMTYEPDKASLQEKYPILNTKN